jgi:rod shape determining protein RodA
MRKIFHKLRSLDWLLNLAVFTLLLFGLAAIYSVALSQEGSGFLTIQKQLIAAAVGVVLYILIASFNYRQLRNYAILFYVVGVVLLVGVLFFGATIRGTTGWYELGFFNFQPVEFMKLAAAVALATYFSQRARKTLGWREVLESGAIIGVPFVLTVIQPDFGSAMLLLGMWGVLILFAGIRMSHLAVLISAGGVMSVIAWFFLLADYQKARLMTFVDPSLDPLGQGYNVRQAIIAVGAGGWFGRGLGFGSQSHLKFLPESQTDFIFAVVAEELGFIGVTLVIMAFGLLFYRIYTHTKRAKDDFSSFLLLAVGTILFLQFFVNVGMNLGLLPVTGLGLPLVSYGGSSLVMVFVLLGIVQSIVVGVGRSRSMRPDR